MITRPISKSISRGIALAINDPNGAGFDPLSLFSAGEQGVWYDPSDLSTLFQDAAGTIPVTAAEQPVGLMRDKSGRGNHATQATATSRPILQTEEGRWYLAFDGVDDGMFTTAINFTATNKVTAFAGFMKVSNAALGALFELSSDWGTNSGTFSLFTPSTTGTLTDRVTSGGTLKANVTTTAAAMSPTTNVLSMSGDISGDSLSMRVNALPAGTPSAADQGTGNYGTYPLYIGRRNNAAYPLNGRIYSLIVRGAASSAQQITDTENYINSKTGAY